MINIRTWLVSKGSYPFSQLEEQIMTTYEQVPLLYVCLSNKLITDFFMS